MNMKTTDNFNEIYLSYYNKSINYVKSYVHDEMETENIVTESFIELWKQMKIKTIDPVVPFLFVILKNKSLNYLRHLAIENKANKLISESLSRELETRISSLESNDPKEIFSDEIKTILHDTLADLSPKTKDIFMDSRFSNKTHKELAEIHNVTVKGIDYHIARAIKALRIALKDYLTIIILFIHHFFR